MEDSESGTGSEAATGFAGAGWFLQLWLRYEMLGLRLLESNKMSLKARSHGCILGDDAIR